MKKILSLVLLAALLVGVCGFAALADEYPDCEHYGQTVTATEDGYINLPFSDGYNGFCIKYGLDEADENDTFAIDDMGLATNNNSGENISQYLKYLFVVYFDEFFDLDSENLTYSLKSDIVMQHNIWHFSDDFTGWRVNPELIAELKAAVAAGTLVIPDHGYTTKLSDTVLATFDFHVLRSGKTNQQNFWAHKITLSRYPAPEVTDPTTAKTVDLAEGGSQTISVTATNAESYQWQVDTGEGFADIPGATQASYQLPNISEENKDYKYRCVVSNTAGSDTSEVFSLNLVVAPVFTTPAEESELEVTLGEDVTLTAVATGADSYQWQVDTGEGFADIPGASDTSYTITGLTEEGLSYKYRCVATNIAGSTTSFAFSLKEKPAPAPTGDESHVLFFAALTCIALLGFAATVSFRKKV